MAESLDTFFVFLCTEAPQVVWTLLLHSETKDAAFDSASCELLNTYCEYSRKSIRNFELSQEEDLMNRCQEQIDEHLPTPLDMVNILFSEEIKQFQHMSSTIAYYKSVGCDSAEKKTVYETPARECPILQRLTETSERLNVLSTTTWVFSQRHILVSITGMILVQAQHGTTRSKSVIRKSRKSHLRFQGQEPFNHLKILIDYCSVSSMASTNLQYF